MNNQIPKGWNPRSENTDHPLYPRYPNPDNSIDLRIEELILHGFEASDCHRIGEGFKLELNRLLAEKGIPSLLRQNNNAASINGGTIHLPPGNKPETIGIQVAQKVYEGLDQWV